MKQPADLTAARARARWPELAHIILNLVVVGNVGGAVDLDERTNYLLDAPAAEAPGKR